MRTDHVSLGAAAPATKRTRAANGTGSAAQLVARALPVCNRCCETYERDPNLQGKKRHRYCPRCQGIVNRKVALALKTKRKPYDD